MAVLRGDLGGFGMTSACLLALVAARPAQATFCSDLAGSAGATLVACDAADNPAYTDGWGLDDAGEIGFGSGFGGSWDFGGSSLRDIAASGNGSVDTGGKAWSVSTGSTALLYNFFSDPLEVGDTLRVRFATEQSLTTGARIGISLHGGLTCQGALLAVERLDLAGGLFSSETRLTDATRNDEGVVLGVPLAGEIAFTLTSATTYDLSAGPFGIPPTTLATPVRTIADVPIRGVCLRVQAAGLQRTAFFNQITVTAVPEPGGAVVAISAVATLLPLARRSRRLASPAALRYPPGTARR